jgi:protein AATF/BFR2
MKTRTRRAGGGLAAELDGLANPAPVSTELPDDDFDPTGGAVAREADRDDASSSGDSEPDANAFADDDEGVFEPTKAERAAAGKGKLRMRAGIAIDDGEYVGKSSSRRAMEGAWAGDEDDDASDDASDEDDASALEDASEDVSEDEAMDVRADALSDEEDDDGTPEEGSEEEHDSDDESESDHDDDDDDDDDVDDPYGGPKKTSASAFETSALEAELAAMRAEEAEANRLVRTKSQNAAKGAAVRTQNACWERSLRTRIVLQKGLTLAAKMPTPAYHRAMRAADAAVAPALAAAAASARGALGALLRLQAALMDANPAVGEALASGTSDSAKVRETFGESRDETRENEKREKRRNGRFYAAAATLDLAAKPVAAAWRAADASFEAFAPFRDQSCDRWHRKAQITSGKMGSAFSKVSGARGASPSALRAFDQALSTQVRAAMTPPDRLVNRSRPPAHLTPRRLGEPVSSATHKRTRGDFENDVDENGEEAARLFSGSGDGENENETSAPRDERVAETYEDADFYEQALKEFLETRGAGSSPGAASVPAASKPPKRRKQVDRRASKGRKLRYHVQQPLVNFCAPAELEVPGWAEKVFTRLFASSA